MDMWDDGYFLFLSFHLSFGVDSIKSDLLGGANSCGRVVTGLSRNSWVV